MTTMPLHGRGLAAWEQRLAKESLSATVSRGAPFGNQARLLNFMEDRRLTSDPMRPLTSDQMRGNWTWHMTKGQSGLAWREYSQARNPIAGYNTRWRHYEDVPYYPDRSASSTTDSFPSEPRMQ